MARMVNPLSAKKSHQVQRVFMWSILHIRHLKGKMVKYYGIKKFAEYFSFQNIP